MDRTCPTDELLRAMGEEEILGPPEGATADDLAGRYPIMLGEVSDGMAVDLGLCDDGCEFASELGSHCYIDLERRTVVHGPACTCIILS